MKLISNSCFGGWLYNANGIPYTTPFIWCRVTVPDMYRLITNYNDINFSKIAMCTTDDLTLFSTIIDKQIKLDWTHYKFAPDATTPIIVPPADVSYNKIWEYIIDKYVTRTRRMMQCHDKPCFLVDFTKDDYLPSIDILETLANITTYNMVIIHPYDNIELNNIPPNICVLKATWNVIKKPFLYEHLDTIRRGLLTTA